MFFVSFNLFGLWILHGAIHYIKWDFGFLCLCILFTSCWLEPTLNTEQRICVKFGCTNILRQWHKDFVGPFPSVSKTCSSWDPDTARASSHLECSQFSPAPLACTTLSGILSRSKWAISSVKTTSWTSKGPLGPAVCRLSLSPTGWPAPVVSVSAFCKWW